MKLRLKKKEINGKMLEKKNRLIWQFPPPFGDAYTMYKIKQFNFKKYQTILILAKYNHACKKEFTNSVL